MRNLLRSACAPWCFCGLVLAGLAICGCGSEKAVKEFVEQQFAEATKQTVSTPPQAERQRSASEFPVSTSQASATSVTRIGRASDRVRIASFNIQVFGTSKLEQSDVMDVLANVVRRFDIVAIQEVRSKDDSVVPEFVDRINVGGIRYDHVIGPRLGRTNSKEQYAFIFDTSRIGLVEGSVFTPSDPQDRLHREPLVASFRSRGETGGSPFTFTLINIHTDPDETDQELDALDDVFRAVQRQAADDDVILLGDLNVDDRHLGELGRVANLRWVISGEPTNTRGTKSYDNIVFADDRTSEFTGAAGVLNLMQEFQLSEPQALKVSDHMPIWAEFSSQEAPPTRIAGNRPATVTQ